MNGPTIGCLFSGYAGLSMAVQQVIPDSEHAWFCEFDPAPSRILAHHWPDVPNLHDITQVDWATVEPVDALTAGYPCQPFSIAGRRKGTDDDRHLWPYVVEAVNVLRPPMCVFENVQGHLTLGFDVVLSDLKALGYKVSWTVMSAASVGAAHRRNRLFILAVRSDFDGFDGLLRSWADRRGGVHRDRVHGADGLDAAQDHDDRQGDSRPSSDEQSLRRGGQVRRASEGEQSREVDVAASRPSCVGSDRAVALCLHGEGGGRADCAAVPGDAGCSGEAPEWASHLDGRAHGASALLREEDQGGEPTRTGAHPAGFASSGSDGRGHGVGTGRGSVRPRPTQEGDPCNGDDALRARLFTPLVHRGVDLGVLAPHPRGGGGGGRAAVAVAGREGGPDTPAVGADPRPNAPGSPAGLTLLPTPAVNDMGAAYTPEQWDEWTARMQAKHGNGNGHGKSLSVEAERLLPTPSANVATNGGSQDPVKRRAGGHQPSIQDVVEHADFGPYAPAIARWEAVTGRPAPAPTEPGRTRPRLSAAFCEWMMGLPAGHVTAVPGLTRNQQLKALGNGVVPLQCEAALRHLIQIAHLEGVPHV